MFLFVALNFHVVKILGNLVFEHFDFVFSLFFCHFFSAKIDFRTKKMTKKRLKTKSKCTKKLGVDFYDKKFKQCENVILFLL